MEQSSLIFNNDGTATDSKTGLMWMLPFVGQSWNGGIAHGEKNEFSWKRASFLYGRARNIFADAVNCRWSGRFNNDYPLNRETYSKYKLGDEKFEFAEVRDWRLPTVEEFWSLSQAGIEDTVFVKSTGQMWTANSTTKSLKGFFYTFDLGGHCSWTFKFGTSSVDGFGDMNIIQSYPIRLVRAGNIFQTR